MSRSGELELEFGGELRRFRLTPVRWEFVQEKCDAGPPELAHRLAMGLSLLSDGERARVSYVDAAAGRLLGSWRYIDVAEPIFQGLMGGGMNPDEAGRLKRQFIDERPLIENVPKALAIVLASIFGAPDEPLGESKGETTATRSPAES